MLNNFIKKNNFMKKFIILPFLLLIFTGCSNDQSADKQSMANENLKVGESPIMQSVKIDSNNFSDLVSQYSQAIIKTNQGDITVSFYASDSPFTVNNFLNLAKLGFYDGTKFHRVIKGFMIQGGDPNSKDNDWSDDGRGGPGYRFGDEFNSHKLVRGSLAMANSGPNTNGSQFFIVTAESTDWLDGKHTNFGKVKTGIDVVAKIENIKNNGKDGNPSYHPTEDVVINSIELLK